MTRMRGAIPTPRHRLAAAMPHRLSLVAAPPQLVVIPPKLSMWLNDQVGDCVTAEEAFAKAAASVMAGQPELFITDATVKTFASAHNLLNGAMLDQVLDLMRAHGFDQDGYVYGDGGKSSIDWTNDAMMADALSQGPVKIGVAADQLEKAVGQHNGWFATGFQRDQNIDHCTGLSGYGPIDWLLGQLGVPGKGRSDLGYLFFTWDTIGVIDKTSLLAICGEAWLRTPTNVGGPTPPPPPPPPPPSGKVMTLTFTRDSPIGAKWSVVNKVAFVAGKYDLVTSPPPPPPPTIDPVVEHESAEGGWPWVLEPDIEGQAFSGAMSPAAAIALTSRQLQALAGGLPFNFQAIIQAILAALTGNCFAPPTPTPTPTPDPTPSQMRAVCHSPSPRVSISVRWALRSQGVRPLTAQGQQVEAAVYKVGGAAPDPQWLGLIAASKSPHMQGD